MRQTPNPVGGVTIISATNVLPDAEKFCAADAVPEQLVNALNVPLVVMVGVAVVCDFGLLVAELVL